MFGQLAMCINPCAGYGATEKTLWAVVGEHMRFTTRDNAHGYQYGLCLEVDPEAQTITLNSYASENDYEERIVDSQKTMHIKEFGRFDVLFDKYIYDMTSLDLAWPSDPVKPLANPQYSAAKGAVLGALIGDAAGGVLEFMGRPPTPKEARKALQDMPGGGVFGLAPGQFTDDGEMTVTLLQTLCNTQGAYRPDLVAQAYCQWEGSAPFDIGIATRSALRVNRDRRQEPKGLAVLVQAQAANNNADSKANGSLMRATPLGIAACGCSVEEAIEMAEADAAMTHPNPTCISATTAYVLALRHLILNAADAGKVEGAVQAAADYLNSEDKANNSGRLEVSEWLEDALHGRLPAAFPQAGFVRYAFTYAFYYLAQESRFEDAIYRSLLEGGDTDTNACIVGGLVGAYVGLGSLPNYALSRVLRCDTSKGQERREAYTAKPVAKNLKVLCQYCLGDKNR
jgi:ADP-ribosylglycohydrolase